MARGKPEMGRHSTCRMAGALGRVWRRGVEKLVFGDREGRRGSARMPSLDSESDLRGRNVSCDKGRAVAHSS